ncbi:MAG: hypothetical protein ABH833_04390 [Parcubacteria group bacterium]
MINDYILTLDVDWAPDWMIEYVADVLIRKHVKATWFVTHASPAIEAIQQKRDLFEIGIHPNCLPGSSHGNNEDEVLRHVKEIVPDAISMRTHSLYQSSPFLTRAAIDYGILIDVSLFLPRTPNLVQHCIRWQGAELWRIPYFWEDDSEMLEDDPIWTFSDPRLHGKGLKVFNFHPAYIILNNNTSSVYEKLKREKQLPAWDLDFINPHISNSCGPRTLFLELVDELSISGGKLIKELVFDKKE